MQMMLCSKSPAARLWKKAVKIPPAKKDLQNSKFPRNLLHQFTETSVCECVSQITKAYKTLRLFTLGLKQVRGKTKRLLERLKKATDQRLSESHLKTLFRNKGSLEAGCQDLCRSINTPSNKKRFNL